MSFLEAVSHAVAGYGLAVITQMLVFPLFGLDASLGDHLLIGAVFTIASIARGQRAAQAHPPKGNRMAIQPPTGRQVPNSATMPPQKTTQLGMTQRELSPPKGSTCFSRETLRRVAKFLFCISLAGNIAACSEHRVDTFHEWCEQITGVDLKAKHSPLWAVIFSVSFDGDAIRDDYVTFLNDAHMEKVEYRAPRTAWREGTELHLVNLSSLLRIEPEKIIGEWRQGIDTAKRFEHNNDADVCLYGTVTSMFDSLHIHSMERLALKWTDKITLISTERNERLGKEAL